MKVFYFSIISIVCLLIFFPFHLDSIESQSNEIMLYAKEKTIPPFQQDDSDVVTIAIASILSPSESFYKYDYLKEYLEKQMNINIKLVQKQTYEEVNDMLKNGQVDFAFICSLSYVLGLKEGYFQGIVVPEINGSVFYQSYTIVAKDSPYDSILDLKGKDYAFTDPISYSGRLSMLMELDKINQNAEEFFDHIYYTYSHDNSIKSVALGAVDGASVDGILYETMKQSNPEIIAKTKVIGIGEATGVPPFVASMKTSAEKIQIFKETLVSLDSNEEGRNVLEALGVDRYVEINNQNYENILNSIYLLRDDDELSNQKSKSFRSALFLSD